MSDIEKEVLLSKLASDVVDLWILPERDDLLEDCIDEISQDYLFYNGTMHVKDLIIIWLQKKLFIANPLSSKDVDRMAKDYGEDKPVDSSPYQHRG